MQWLNEWIREIVLIVLLATFLDLILPNSTMERYVKVVIGLLIILTVLSPVITLLRSDWSLDQWQLPYMQMEAAPAMATLSEVMQEGKQLRDRHEQQSVQLLRDEMETAITETVHAHYPGIVTEIKTNLQLDADGQPTLQRLTLILKSAQVEMKEKKKQVEREYTMAPVEPIKPVEQIDIRTGLSDAKSQKQVNSKQHLHSRHEEVRAELRRILTVQYPFLETVLQINYDLEL